MYHLEFIDVNNFLDSSYRVAFDDFIRLKDQGIAFDLVIAMGDVAAASLSMGSAPGCFRRPRPCSWRTIARPALPATRLDP